MEERDKFKQTQNNKEADKPVHENLSYVSWENVHKLLRVAKHSLRIEHDFISARAAADQQYADSLEKMAGDLRTALRHDELMEYGPHKDVLWYLSEEATQVARFHHRVSADLRDQMGPAEAIKRFRAQSHHKKVTKLATKTSQEMDEFHQKHKKVYGSLFSDILNTQQSAEKYEKMVAKTLDLGEQVRQCHVKNKGTMHNDHRVRLHREETELLNQESTAVCLSDQYNSRIRRIQAMMPDIRQKSENFMKEIMTVEQERLCCVLAQVSNYWKTIGQKESESEEYMKMMGETKKQLHAMDPSEIVWSWRHTHSENIELPKPMGTGCYGGPGIVTTLLRTSQKNAYGYKDTVSDMFRADFANHLKTHGTSPLFNEPSSSFGQAAKPACMNDGDSASPLRPVSRRLRRSRTPLHQNLQTSPAGAINLDNLDSDIEEDTGRICEVTRGGQQLNLTNVQPANLQQRSPSKHSEDTPTPKQKKDAWVGGFDSTTSNDSL